MRYLLIILSLFGVLFSGYGQTSTKVRVKTTKSVAKQGEKNDIFGSTKEMFFSLKGDIYLVDSGFSGLSELSKYKPTGSIYTKKINIPITKFDRGFPGITNRFEWFAIDYNGTFYIAKTRDYCFSLLSDDGSLLYIDNQLIIENDGLHQPLKMIQKIPLAKGYHQIRLTYFQGPRLLLALQLKMSTDNIEYVPFDLEKLNPLTIQDTPNEIKILMKDGILFDFDSDNIQDDTKKILEEIKRYYLDRITFKEIIIEGHTDDIGSNEYNQTLSQRRADGIANFFISEGISKEKIKTIGYGEEKPLVKNDNDQDRATNRRVELRIIK